MKEKLAALLVEVTDGMDKPLMQIAADLGMARQRLHQLRTAHRSAAPETIANALETLGYEVEVTLKPKQ